MEAKNPARMPHEKYKTGLLLPSTRGAGREQEISKKVDQEST